MFSYTVRVMVVAVFKREKPHLSKTNTFLLIQTIAQQDIQFFPENDFFNKFGIRDMNKRKIAHIYITEYLNGEIETFGFIVL